MPSFSETSLAHLGECHPQLQKLFKTVGGLWDCTVLDGGRTLEEQAENVRKGVSKTMNSKHLLTPSWAVDVAPYPINWEDSESFYHFAGFVKGIAAAQGVRIRWGGDWDGDFQLHDQTFFDLPHFELLEE